MFCNICRPFAVAVAAAAAVVLCMHALPARALASPDQTKSSEKKSAPDEAKKADAAKKGVKADPARPENRK